MTPQERDIIGQFIARVGGNAPQIAGSVPSTQAPLPPIDPEADRYIGDQFASHPEARYRITQLAFVQEAALTEAQNRIRRLEYDLQTAQQQAQQAPQQGQSRGLFGGLFGGGAQSAPPRPAYQQQQQYAPPPQPTYAQGGYQPGMFGSGGGSGFLGSALTTAAGVAGGVLAADAISSMFSGHGGGFGGGGFGGGGFGGMGGGWGGGGEVINETTVNNYGSDAAGAGGADPWSGAGTSDSGSWDQGGGQGFNDSGPADTGGDAWGGAGDSGDSNGGDFGGGGDAGWDDSGGGGGDSSF